MYSFDYSPPADPCIINVLNTNLPNGLPDQCYSFTNFFLPMMPVFAVGGVFIVMGGYLLQRELRRQFGNPAINANAGDGIPLNENDNIYEALLSRLNDLNEKITAEFAEEFNALKEDLKNFKDENTCPITHEIMTEPAGLQCSINPDLPQELHFFEMNALLQVHNHECPLDRVQFNPENIEVNLAKRDEISDALEALTKRLAALEEKVLGQNADQENLVSAVDLLQTALNENQDAVELVEVVTDQQITMKL